MRVAGPALYFVQAYNTDRLPEAAENVADCSTRAGKTHRHRSERTEWFFTLVREMRGGGLNSFAILVAKTPTVRNGNALLNTSSSAKFPPLTLQHARSIQASGARSTG